MDGFILVYLNYTPLRVLLNFKLCFYWASMADGKQQKLITLFDLSAS
jgi:hypothetical protein